jgi:hypothetical protein
MRGSLGIDARALPMLVTRDFCARCRAEVDRQEVDPPVPVETAVWSRAGQLDWWVKEGREWFGRVRGADGRQRWVKAVDLRRAKSE